MSRTLPLLLLLTTAASAQTYEITPFLAFQGGGTLRTDDAEGDFEEPLALGIFVTSDRGEGRMLDVLVSTQNTEAVHVDVSITYLQLGGRYLLKRGTAVSPYIALTAGAAHFALEGDSSIWPAGTAGGGVDVRLSERVALRLDGRFYATMLNAEGEIGCRGGSSLECVASAEGGRFTQFAASAGVVMRF